MFGYWENVEKENRDLIVNCNILLYCCSILVLIYFFVSDLN